MVRTWIDFHISFQSHPTSGWLFYLPPTLGREGEDVGILNKGKPLTALWGNGMGAHIRMRGCCNDG